jgi:hypothetical protein
LLDQETSLHRLLWRTQLRSPEFAIRLLDALLPAEARHHSRLLSIRRIFLHITGQRPMRPSRSKQLE